MERRPIRTVRRLLAEKDKNLVRRATDSLLGEPTNDPLGSVQRSVLNERRSFAVELLWVGCRPPAGHCAQVRYWPVGSWAPVSNADLMNLRLEQPAPRCQARDP